MIVNRTKDIVLLACLSRLVCIVLAVLSHGGVQADDQRNTILFGSKITSGIIYDLISPLIQWDGVHFLNIAAHGHDAVLSHAFFPGLPMLMRGLYAIFPSISGDVSMDLSILGLLFVQFSFVAASVGLYKLSCAVLLSEKAAFRSTLFYVFASSNIFMSALYTESPFSMFTFWGIYWLYIGNSLTLATFFFACASVIRSNGILSIIYLVLFGIKSQRIYDGIFASLVVYLPYLLYSMSSYNQYCDPAVGVVQEWCDARSIYEHVQLAFWRVSFLSYWNKGNWPYFLLMSPSLLVALHAPFHYLQDLFAKGGKIIRVVTDWKFPFLVQMGILTVFTVFIANCQILTRILSSCPLYFWTLHRITATENYLGRALWLLHFSYFLTGPLVFANGYNWT